MEVTYFTNHVPKDLYKKLNRDKGMNYYFRSDKVGKCVKIFDEYYQGADKVTANGWHNYYFKQCNVEALQNATDYIVEKHGASIRNAKLYIYHRIIGQTWNGMLEEFNAINELRELYPNLDFRKTKYDIDEMYFTDWEAYGTSSLMFGLQIKPHTYELMGTTYQVKARENHREQMLAYQQIYKVAHFMVYYENHKIKDKDLLRNKIDTYLAYNIQIN